MLHAGVALFREPVRPGLSITTSAPLDVDLGTVTQVAHDALTARVIEKTGFPAVYMTGYGQAASHLGRPDIGLMSMTEMVARARNIAAVVDVPVIADADTGFGNVINVIRTVKEYEAANVAAIQIEDQVLYSRGFKIPCSMFHTPIPQ